MLTSIQIARAFALLTGKSSLASVVDMQGLRQQSRSGGGKVWDRHPARNGEPSSQPYQPLRHAKFPAPDQSRTSVDEPQGKLDGRGKVRELLRDAIQIPVATGGDIVAARRQGRELALRLGFSRTESTLVATAISELGRNIVLYAKSGAIRLEPTHDGERTGLVIVACDDGPGIRDIQRALLGGYSTSEGLGLGLSGVRRIMDDLDVDSGAGKGTTIIARKWRELRR